LSARESILGTRDLISARWIPSTTGRLDDGAPRSRRRVILEKRENTENGENMVENDCFEVAGNLARGEESECGNSLDLITWWVVYSFFHLDEQPILNQFE